MEEKLYGIEIQKEGDNYLGKIFSDVGGLKEFRSNKLELLLRDITYDMRLALGDLSVRNIELFEDKD